MSSPLPSEGPRRGARAARRRRSSEEADTHLVYLVDGGYRIVERDGHVPAVGASVDVDGRPFVVVSTGRSLLPGDRRRCAYLEPTRTAPSVTERA